MEITTHGFDIHGRVDEVLTLGDPVIEILTDAEEDENLEHQCSGIIY